MSYDLRHRLVQGHRGLLFHSMLKLFLAALITSSCQLWDFSRGETSSAKNSIASRSPSSGNGVRSIAGSSGTVDTLSPESSNTPSSGIQGSDSLGGEGLTPEEFAEIFNKSEKPLITALDFNGEGKNLAFVYQISKSFNCKIEFLKKSRTGFSRIPIDSNPFEKDESKMTVCIPPQLKDLDGDGKLELVFTVPTETGAENLEIFRWNGKGLSYISPFKKNKSGQLERIFKNMSILTIHSNIPPLLFDSEVGRVQFYALTNSGFSEVAQYAFFEEIEKRSLNKPILRTINLAHGGEYLVRIVSKNPNTPLYGGKVTINNTPAPLSLCKVNRTSRLTGAAKILRQCQGQNMLLAPIRLRRENNFSLNLNAQVGTQFYLTLEKK